MKIVTDSTCDLSYEQMTGLDIQVVPLHIKLDSIDYRSGLDVSSDEMYLLLEASKNLPFTSPPYALEFQQIYEYLAEEDDEILSIHLSSGLSDTVKKAAEAAAQIKGARITVIDSGTVTGALGWQVEAAARAARAGWGLRETLDLIGKVRAATDMMFTVDDLTYLVHGGRISHLMGGIANFFNIKPIIAINPETLIYENRSMVMTFTNALRSIADLVLERNSRDSRMRLQLGHVNNPRGVEELRGLMEMRFLCEWLPDIQTDPILGAHTGPTLTGIAYANLDEFPDLP